MRRNVDWRSVDGLLGAVPDRRICERLGVKPSQVLNRRRKLHIPAPNPRKGGVLNQHLSRLGSVPDRELAAELGLSVSTVRGRRQRAGIPSFVPPNSRKLPAYLGGSDEA